MNSFKQQPIIETIHVCTTTPEKLCNVTLDAPIEAKLATRIAPGLEEQCDVHYKTVCETKYEEKEIIEEIPICNDIAERSCNEDGGNCVEFMKRVKHFY